MINNEFVGDIGIYQQHKKFGTSQGIDGFLVPKKLIRPINEITIYLQSDDLVSFGLNDQRLYLGVKEYLQSYLKKIYF